MSYDQPGKYNPPMANAPPYPTFESPPPYTSGEPLPNAMPMPQPQVVTMPPPQAMAMPPPPPGMPYSGSQPPITTQPTSTTTQGVAVVQWTTTTGPTNVPNCPPGLEYLAQIDQLLVHQKVELLEAVTGFETQNKYNVRNSLGQEVFYAKEQTDCCTRNCCGPMRPFDMKISDNYKNEVIHLYRPLRCMSCCCPCCLQSLEVASPPGNIIGKVEQKWSIFWPSFAIKNESGETMYKIEGPFWTCSCCCNDVVFKITTADGKREVGNITKQWSGLIKEGLTDADNFGITFPLEMDVKMKAVLLGACFLIDFMYFEQTGKKQHHHHG